MPRYQGQRYVAVKRPAARAALVASLLVVFGLGAVAPSAGAASSPAGPGASAAAVKKKVKLCVVKRRTKSGRLVTVYTTTLVYKRVNGKRRIVRKRVPRHAPCTKRCVVQRVRGGKLTTVYVIKRVTVKVRVGNRIVKRKVKRRVPKTGKCPKSSSGESGVPVTITLIQPSHATLDFQAFQREAPLSGSVRGFIPGGLSLGKDNQITLTRGTIDVTPTDIFIDDVCNDRVTSSIRTGPGSKALIDQTKTSSVLLDPVGKLQGIIYLKLRVALELRNDDNGCDRPYLQTGYTDTPVRLFVSGKLDGLTSTLRSGEQLLSDLTACISLGNPNNPCSGFAIPFPTVLSSVIVGEVTIG